MKTTFVNQTLDNRILSVTITNTGTMIKQGENQSAQRISLSLNDLKTLKNMIDSAIYQFENNLPNS